ncbi:MAG: DUF1385 domain-containing protein [Clostridia bacterium]|nr:MAG: DUF1385 domain-containing protein [Clostridia bacterium]
MAREVFQYGGQAVIEGVMMRGPRKMAVAVRRADGDIALEISDSPPWATLSRFLSLPMVRGVVGLIESLVVGIQVLTFSANMAVGEDEEQLRVMDIVLSLLVAVAVAVLLFVVLPTAGGLVFSGLPLWGQNLIEGGLRLAIFILYLVAISRMRDIRRVFAYHGAEHKVIHAYEAGRPLEVPEVRPFSTLHPRCGTSFLLIVLLLTVLFFSLVPASTLGMRIVSRVVLLPLVAGTGYELLKLSSRNMDKAVVRWLVTPGLWVQKLTTREPDDAQLEVAISALQAVLAGKEKVVTP